MFHDGNSYFKQFKELYLIFQIHNSIRFSSAGIDISRLLEIKEYLTSIFSPCCGCCWPDYNPRLTWNSVWATS